MRASQCSIEDRIRDYASGIGLDACGFAVAGPVSDAAVAAYDRWIESGANGCMEWAARYREVRNDPRLLLEGAQSIVMVAMNYYPAVRRRPDVPQFALYAYGRDYHEVVRERLHRLAQFIKDECPGAECRCCVDTAPLRERYWAQQAGLGFVGRNNQLIVPGRGSHFFLGAVITTARLTPDAPCTLSCGDCMACENACPASALTGGIAADCRRCLSCLTIEHRGPLPQWVAVALGNRVYGCDECQRVCPHNSNATPCTAPEFQPSPEFLNLTAEQILGMDQQEFSRVFSHSAVKRAKLDGLQRNAESLAPSSLSPDPSPRGRGA